MPTPGNDVCYFPQLSALVEQLKTKQVSVGLYHAGNMYAVGDGDTTKGDTTKGKTSTEESESSFAEQGSSIQGAAASKVDIFTHIQAFFDGFVGYELKGELWPFDPKHPRKDAAGTPGTHGHFKAKWNKVGTSF